MGFSRLHKRIFAASMAIFMFVGEVGNLPPSSALAKQTDVVQSVENAANSNIPAPKTEESLPIGDSASDQTEVEKSDDNTANSNIPAQNTQVSVAVPTVEQVTLPAGGVTSNQVDNENNVENPINSNIPAPQTQESIPAPTDEAEPEVEKELNKDAIISAKVLSGTSEDENEETIENIELQELGGSDIPFVDGPNGAGNEFVIEPGTEKHLSFTIPEEGFSPGSYVIAIDTVAGSEFNFSCSVTDSEANELAKSYYYYSEYNSSRNIYFTLKKPGAYQFNVFDVYFNNEDNQNAAMSSNVYKTIDPPVFGVTEESFTEPFYLTFTDIPEGYKVYYYIFDYSQNKGEEPQDTLYDPQKLDKINTECNVYAYCLAEGENGTLTSETVYQNYYPDIERAACSALYPNNIIESGGSITLTTEDPTLEIYYILDSEWMRCSSNYIKENGTLYTGPIKVEGQENDGYYLYFITVNSEGVLSGVDLTDFTIGTPPPPVPEFSPEVPDCGTIYSPIVWESPKNVTVTSKPDTSICYRINQYGMQIEEGMDGVYTTPSNTLTLDIDRDMYIEACAYDRVKSVYSNNYGRAYVIKEPKTLTVTQSGETSVEGKIFTGYDESFIINVQQAGAYKITIERPELSWWYDYSLPVYLYDSDDNVLVALDDSDSQKRNTLNIERNLEVGTYKLVLAEDQSGRSWMQSYKLTISKGMEPPQFSVPGGIYGEEFDLVLSHSDSNSVIYYSLNGGEYIEYTGPITISKTTSIYAYASIGGVNSNTVYAYYQIDLDPPVLESYWRFINSSNGNNIYSSTVLTGQVPVRAINIYDYNSGIDYVDYYLSVNGGAYNKIGSAPWGTDFVWDTTSVTESNEGSVSVRLLPIAYDKAGNASAKESDLNSEYDSQYSPIFHINNAPCAPVDSLTYNEGVGSIKLNWTREPELKSGDMILIYRAETEGELSQNLIKEIYYYYKEYSDYFLTKESLSAAYYYGVSVRDARGVESAMQIIGPVSPLEDTNGPEISVAGVEENGYKNSGSIIINSSDETAVSSMSAKITASDGTEIIPSGSPWTFEPYRGGNYSGRISEDELAALSDGAYTLFATATDFFDNSSSMTVHFIKDSIAPQAPVLTASSIPGQIDLRWTASADEDVVGYNVLYSESEDGTFSSLNYSLLTERSFTYPSYGSGYLEPGAAYWFKIQAVDRAGNIGETEPVKGTAGKYNPKIRLINENPRLGDNIEIAFSGFKQSEYVYFYLDRNEEPFTYAYIYDPSEESTATMNADLSLRGVHTIRAVGEKSGAVAQIRVTISDLSASVILTPAIVTGKNSFNVKLDGFPTGKPIYFYLDPVDSSTASDVPYTYFYENDDYNSVDLYLSSFNNPSPGAYVLRAVEPVSGLSAFATLTVAEPEVSLRCEKEKPSAGEYVQFYAAGFDSADVDLYINGELVATVSRAYYQTEHSFYVLIPEVYKDVDAVLATAVQTSTGKEASIKVALNRASANISISKESVGFESFTISGSGFGNNEEVKLFIDGVEKSSATHYDNSVSFTYSFGYDTQPGRHGIELRGEESGLTAIGSIVFTDSVQTLILSDDPTLYQPLTLYAGGFCSGESVSFSINDVISGNGYADANGNASYTVDSLEYSPANGSYTFTAKGESSNRVAFYGISAESGGDLRLSYEGNIRSGSTVNITVTGLDAGENADVYVKNRKEAAIMADSSGRAVAQFVVPKGYAGNIPVTVHGKASQKWGTVSVPVTDFNPSVTVTPELPTAGSVITAEVAGHMPGATLHLKFDDYNSANDAVVSQDGTASLNYTIPANMATGEHTLSVYDSVTGMLIKRSVNVAPPSLTLICPKTALPGDTISLGASGLLSGEVLRVSVNGTSVGGNLIEAGGTATTTYTLPNNAASGNYKVVFAFEKMAVTQMAVISVTVPVASVQAVMDEKNAAITIHAQNFMPNEPLSVYFDNREINDSLESYTANAEGTIDALYTLPVTTFAGDHKVDLLGRNSYRRASTVVNVKETGPIISISGGFSEGKAGDTLSFEGVNFTPLGQYDLYFESELLSKDANVDENGEISGTFTIPEGFSDGRYRLIANDKSGGKTALCYIRIDTTPPGAPSLSLFARKQSIVLSWDAPADEDVASYSVYCKPEGNEGYIKLAEIDGAVTTWTHDMRNSDCPITVGKRYEYIIRATDRLGNEGEGSAVISAVLADGTDAPVITGAVATTGSSISINNEYLSTIKGKENEFYVSVSDDQQISKIEITAAPENGEFLLVGSTVPSYSNNNGGNSEYRATLTVDTTVFSDGIHTFRFTAFDSSGNIGSIERRYYVDNTPPPPVTGLKVVGASNSIFVSWSWTADATGEVPERYNVYYSKEKNFETYDYTSVYTYEGTKSYTIRGLEPNTHYYIRVTALDIAGNESTWAEGNATPILDVEKPVITQITPDEQRLGKNVYFWIEATDNSEVNLNSARAEINAGENGSFIPFGSYSYGAIRADNLNYNGTYRIRFYISDIAGNESDAYEITREIDTSVTIVTGLTASPAAGGIKLTWDRSPDKDLSYYYVYRSEGGDFALINYLSPLKITSGDTVR